MKTLADFSGDRREALRLLFERALLIPLEQRGQFIAIESGDDGELRDALLSLLTAFEESEGYFEALGEQLIGPALAAFADSPPDDPADVEQRVSHYEVIERIGGGGMGVVYKARDLWLGRTVALKFLPSQLTADATARARLLAEAQAASALDHPNIGVVYEVADSEEKRPFIAMAWYEGETLREKLRRGPLPVAEAVTIAGQVAGALAAAHAAGIIHRDVKPANVLLTRAGTVKLVDFGIAKLIGADITAEPVTRGTLAYMSPEQTHGGALDASTDLWSLGVVLYEMLAGERPFRGESDGIVVHAIRHDKPPDIVTLRPEVSPALNRIVKRCLRKEPAERYRNASEVSTALDAWTGAAGEAVAWGLARFLPHGVSARRTHRVALGGVAVLAVLIVATGALALARRGFTTQAFGPTPVSVANRGSVAVLPFANRDGDPAEEHLSAGFTDELIRAMGKAPDLRVAARASVAALSRQGLSPRAIGDRMGVATVLDGSVRRTGERLQVSVQLMYVADSAVLWSADYDRPMSEVFAVYQEISDAVVRAIVPLPSRPAGVRTGRPTADLEAYELYLKGRFAWNYRTRDKLEEALAYYRGAIERDPDFALAYSATADAYVNLSNFEYMPAAEALARADVAAARAIALDPSLAEAHASRGFVLASNGVFAASDSSFRRAVTLNANYTWAHHYYTLLLMMQNRLEEASDHNRRALALDPLSLPAIATTGIILSQRGQYGASRTELTRAVAVSPDFPLSRYYLGVIEARDSNYRAALEALEHARRHAPGFPGVRAALAYTYRKIGRDADAQRLLNELRAAVKDERSRINYALGLAVVGDADSAFSMLQSARWDVPTLIELRANPLLDGFRRDPRYAQLLTRAGLEP